MKHLMSVILTGEVSTFAEASAKLEQIRKEFLDDGWVVNAALMSTKDCRCDDCTTERYMANAWLN